MPQQQKSNVRTLCAAVLGIALGFIFASKSLGMLEAGILVMIVGAIINPIIVSFVATRAWIIVACIPTASEIFSLLFLNYQQLHRYEGVDFSGYISRIVDPIGPMTITYLVWLFLPAILTAIVFHSRNPA